MVIDDNCRSFAFVLSVYAKTVEGRPFASLVCNVCTCCGVAESLHSRMLLWWTVWYRGLWRWKSLEVKLDWSSLVNRALQSSEKASQSRRAMTRALPPSFFVLPQWQLRFIWHSGCIISVCLPLLAILVRRSQASWACALQRQVGDFVPVTGHWNRLDALTRQVNAELLITGLDVYYNPDSLRCKARPFMTSQHVFRDVFLGCRMWDNIGMAWHGQQWRLDSWWHRYNWCIRCSPVEYERHESWGRTDWAADHNDRSELAAGGRGGSCNLESFRPSQVQGPKGSKLRLKPTTDSG